MARLRETLVQVVQVSGEVEENMARREEPLQIAHREKVEGERRLADVVQHLAQLHHRGGEIR